MAQTRGMISVKIRFNGQFQIENSEVKRRLYLLLQEICGDPQLFVDGANRMDINQGALGKAFILCTRGQTCVI